MRNLRLSGASTEMLEAAKALKCASCARQQSTKAVEPGRLRPVGDFNAAVALDFIHVKDVAGKAYWCLSCVDLTTTYHVVGLVTSHKPAEIAQIFNDIWITPFGMPRQLNVDQDGAFRSRTLESLSFSGPTPPRGEMWTWESLCFSGPTPPRGEMWTLESLRFSGPTPPRGEMWTLESLCFSGPTPPRGGRWTLESLCFSGPTPPHPEIIVCSQRP